MSVNVMRMMCVAVVALLYYYSIQSHDQIPLPWKLEDQILTDKVSVDTPHNFQTWEDRSAHMWTVQDGKDGAVEFLYFLSAHHADDP